MAGSSIIGALRVVLGLDTATFDTGLKSAAKRASDFGTQFKAVFGGVTLSRVVERTFDAIVYSIKKAITTGFQFADEMGKMAQRVGVPVEQLSALRVAAELSDVSMESLSAGLGKLSKAMVEAAGGSKAMVDQFAALGIEVRDSVTGSLRPTIDVFSDIADKFEKTEDGAGKVTAAMALLGKGGKDLITLLNGGSASLKEMTELAKNMGLVIEQNTTNQVQRFNDDLRIVSFSLEGVANMVIAEVIPALVRMSGEMVNSVKSGDQIKALAKTIADSFKSIVKWSMILGEANVLLGEAFVALQDGTTHAIMGMVHVISSAAAPIIKAVKFIVDQMTMPFQNAIKAISLFAPAVVQGVGKALDFLSSKMPKVEDDVTGVSKAFEDWKKSLQTDEFDKASAKFDLITAAINRLKLAPEAAAKLVEEMFAKFEQGAKKASGAADTPTKAVDQLAEKMKSLKAQALEASGAFAGQVAPGFLTTAEGMEQLNGQVTILGNGFIKLGPEATKLNNALLLLEGFRLSEEFLTPWQQYEQQLLRINAVLQAQPQFAGVAEQASLKAAATMATAYGEAAHNIVGPVASAFKDIASMNKKYAGLAKAAAIGEALVNTYLGATKAFTATVQFGLPFAIAAAAAATAAGLANVAKISATEFARGGSFRVGGSGGMDSQMVQFMATPGEMVDVRTPGELTQRGGGSTEVTLRARRLTDMLTLDDLRDLVESLNSANRDGYKLKVAT